MPNAASIRLGTTGSAQVKATFADIGRSGSASFTAVGEAAERAMKRATLAVERAERDEVAAATRKRNALAKRDLLAPGLSPAKLDSYAGSNDNIGRSAAASAEVFEAAYRKMEVRAASLVAAIDPVFAAQQRFDREMAQAKTLLDAGALSAERYAQVERALVGQLNATTVAHAKGASSVGAHRAAMMGLSYQAQDTFTQLSMGANPLQVLAIQGGQVAGQFSMLEGAAGSVARFMMGPWGLAITGGALVLGALTKGMFDGKEAAEAKEKAAADLTAAIDSLSDANRRAVESERMQRAETLASANALLTKAAAAREATRAEIAGQIQRAKAAIVTQSQPGGSVPGAMFSEGVRQEEQARQRIRDLQEIMDKQTAEEAKARDTVRTIQLAGANANIAAATDKMTAATGKYSEAVAKLATQYRDGKITLSEYEAGGLKLKRSFDEQSAAIKESESKTRSHSSATKEAAKAVRDAAAAVKEHARDLASLEDRYDPATAATRRYREELAKLAGLGLDPARNKLFGEGLRADFVKSRAAAFDLPTIEDFRPEGAAEDKRVADAADGERRRAEFVKQTMAGQSDSIALAERDLQLVRASDATRDSEMAKLRLILDLRREGVDLGSDEGPRILSDAERYDLLTRKLHEQTDAWRTLSSIGGNALDKLFDPTSADTWGDRVKGVLGDLKGELIKLALLNPLKNLLFGEKNATIGSVIGSIGKLFGRNAVGTEYWSGGMSLVGENGPELVNLPRGSQVKPAAETARMIGRGGPALHFDLRGAVMTQDLLNQMNAIAAQSSQAALTAAAPEIVGASFAYTRDQMDRRGVIRLGAWR